MQQMENLKSEKYLSFPIEKLVDNTITDFDLFINVSNHLILYGALGYKWEKAEMESLIESGHKTLYIRPEDVNKVKMYHELNRLPQIEKDLAPKERILSLEQVGASFTKCLYEGELTPASVNKATQISTAIIECVQEDPACIQAIKDLAHHDFYTYYHSVRVATYSAAIAISLGIKESDKITEMSLGALLHDIGKKNVDLEIVNKVGPLNEQEWQQMRAHPENGYNLIEDAILTHVPREIILHHHEKMDGSGYPHGLDRFSLLPEVQIATLADVFDALTSSRSYQKKRTRFEALDFIKSKMIGSKLPWDAYKALVECLAL